VSFCLSFWVFGSGFWVCGCFFSFFLVFWVYFFFLCFFFFFVGLVFFFFLFLDFLGGFLGWWPLSEAFSSFLFPSPPFPFSPILGPSFTQTRSFLAFETLGAVSFGLSFASSLFFSVVFPLVPPYLLISCRVDASGGRSLDGLLKTFLYAA